MSSRNGPVNWLFMRFYSLRVLSQEIYIVRTIIIVFFPIRYLRNIWPVAENTCRRTQWRNITSFFQVSWSQFLWVSSFGCTRTLLWSKQLPRSSPLSCFLVSCCASPWPSSSWFLQTLPPVLQWGSCSASPTLSATLPSSPKPTGSQGFSRLLPKCSG